MPISPLFRRIDVAPAYQKVADAIEREIVNGRIKPGDPIGTEHDLVRQFGVNRSTVREGIRVLEEGGLISRDSSRRLHACLPRYTKLASRLSRALVLHEVTFRELYEASMTLEVASIEGAVERATEENLAELTDNLGAASSGRRSRNACRMRCRIPRAGRQGLAEPRAPARTRAGGAAVLSDHRDDRDRRCRRRPRLVAAHRHLIDAIRRRDREAGVLWTRRQLQDWRRGFEKIASLDRSVEHMYMEHAQAARRR